MTSPFSFRWFYRALRLLLTSSSTLTSFLYFLFLTTLLIYKATQVTIQALSIIKYLLILNVLVYSPFWKFMFGFTVVKFLKMNPEDDFKSISLMYHIYKLFAVHVDVQVRLSASLKETNWLLDGVNWNFGRSKSLLYVSTNVLRNQKGKKLIVIELLSSRSTVNVQLST